MNNLYSHIIFLLSITISLNVISQTNSGEFTRKNFQGKMTNVQVVDAKMWHHQGKIEKSLKKGLEILYSKVPLTAIDSFHTYQILAYNFKDLNAHDLALEHAQVAIKIAPRSNPGDLSRIVWIASYYSKVEKYETAIEYLKLGLNDFIEKSDTGGFLMQYNNLGYTYKKNNQSDSAIKYYNKVINFELKTDKFNATIGLATGNLGSIHLENGDYLLALNNMTIDAELSESTNKSSYYNAMNGIAECHLKMKNHAEAINTLLQIDSIKHEYYDAKIQTFSLLAEAYGNINEHKKSIYYLNKIIQKKDSINEIETPADYALKQLSNAKISGIKTELELSENKAESEKFKNNVYTFLLILAIVTTIIIIIYFRSRNKKNLSIKELEKELISIELNNKKKDLTGTINNLSYKRDFIDEVQLKLKEVNQLPKDQIQERLTTIIRDFNNYKNADKTMAALQMDLDKVNLSFFQKLEEKFPTLTKKEKELCGLLILNLSSKDIATIRNITPNAVKKARQRIRKKLPIEESQELTTFLENV